MCQILLTEVRVLLNPIDMWKTCKQEELSCHTYSSDTNTSLSVEYEAVNRYKYLKLMF